MTRDILTGAEARASLMRGMQKLAEAVGATLGPAGRNVIIGGSNGVLPRSTRDGDTVAHNINFVDPDEYQGAFLLRQASAKTVEEAGDGTTTSTWLAYSMIKAAEERIAAGENPNKIKAEIDSDLQTVLAELDKMKTPVKQSDYDVIEYIATISGNNDSHVGKIVREAYEKIGDGGVISLADSNTGETYVERHNGVELESGFISPHFVNNGKQFRSDLRKVKVLLCTETLEKFSQKSPAGKGMMEAARFCADNGYALLVIAKDITGEVLASLVSNKTNGILVSCAVKAPYFGTKLRENLEDIAAVVGGKVVDPEKGFNQDNFDLSCLGDAEVVMVSQKTTIITGGAGDPSERIEVLKSQLQISDDDVIRNRLAKISGGVAVINVGASTDLEQKELKDRYDDAYKAVRAAIEDGYVPGGGSALLRINLGTDGVMHTAIAAPFEKILANAGYEAFEIEEKAIAVCSGDKVFDAKAGVYGNHLEMGLIDPTKVVKSAIRNAASIAGTVILTGAVVLQHKE